MPCGTLRYECQYKPKEVTYCHCDDCRKANGCAFNVGMEADAEAPKIVAGHVKGYTKKADFCKR
ncbi:MAG: GFA family protein [Planctomycetota bacterium]